MAFTHSKFLRWICRAPFWTSQSRRKVERVYHTFESSRYDATDSDSPHMISSRSRSANASFRPVGYNVLTLVLPLRSTRQGVMTTWQRQQQMTSDTAAIREIMSTTGTATSKLRWSERDTPSRSTGSCRNLGLLHTHHQKPSIELAASPLRLITGWRRRA